MPSLGTYSVVPGKAGANAALCKGSGDYGLDVDFCTVVKQLASELESRGVKITLGTKGYMSKGEAQRLESKSPGYLAELGYFGWGLGWEIGGYVEHGGDKVSATKFFGTKAMSDVLKAVSLEYCESKKRRYRRDGEDSILTYLRPAYVVEKSGLLTMLHQRGDMTRPFPAMLDEVVEQAFESAASGDSTTADSAASGSVTAESTTSLASASYFFANQFLNVQNSAESNMLKGERALANDEPLWDTVKKAVNASLRTCSSDAEGNFLAWYPDYYGTYGKTPRVVIKDVELINLTISQSDDQFYSHVFCPGVTPGGEKIDMSTMWTQGIVSIESDTAATVSGSLSKLGIDALSDEVAPILDELIYIPEGDRWKYTPKELYRRYGARPAKTPSLPVLASSGGGKLIEDVSENEKAAEEGTTPEHIMPFLYALYEFMYHWSNQYSARIETTFMPEVMPGMRLMVESLDISFYVKGVSHSMGYTGGFTTTIETICPVGTLVSGMVNPRSADDGDE